MNDNAQPLTANTEPSGSGKRRVLGKLALFGLLAGLTVLAYSAFGDQLSFEYLARQEAALREYRQENPVWSIAIALVIYVAVVGLSLPGATVLTLAYGWFFGFWKGLLIVSLSSTGGATLAFMLTRYFLQSWVQQRFEQRLETVNAAFEREGAFYLFTLRLIPAVPFFVINAVMGLTKIRAGTFWWVSQLGMLPGTAAYVYAGSSVPSLQRLAEDGVGTIVSWQLMVAFAILGLMPLLIKRIVGFVSQRRQESPA